MRILRTWSAVLPLIATAAWLHAENGIAWDVQGNWQLNHTSNLLRRGDDIAPGSLLTAETSTNASILALLPDGQRLLFECHESSSCSQGFRVPALLEKPDDAAIKLFDSIRAAMHQPAGNTLPAPAPNTSQTEAIVPMQTDGTILLKQPLAALPPGKYRMTIQRESDAQQSEQQLTWLGPQDDERLSVPGTGVYSLRLFGDLGVERMRVFLLVESASLFPSQQEAFTEAKKDLQEWNESFPGWPMHDWLQLFLRFLAQSE